ncbi:LINE-1 type transposase domain-containing protein 1 [Mastomys coucha]|uniref:LINE-1 type transposase domain-containing protein 1 n=1 Tax=Mastomys coucha TaxID=35658 RepID=UPI00126152B4|nr:LINE-1 type transposase domain-containing protein 1 [Mastomys coucha]XP_031233767.1 LINE-1 type transposase domain-containing protein 1 [Mastomys coucha]
MSGVQSKAARLQKEQKEKPSADRERKMATSPSLKHNEVPASMMEQFNALMEMQEVMFAEMREAYKNDIKEMLLKPTAPWVRRLEEPLGQQEGDAASERPKPREKVEEESSGTEEGTENLTVRSKEKSKLDEAEQFNCNHVVKLSLERAREVRRGEHIECQREISESNACLLNALEREAMKNAGEKLASCQNEENRLKTPKESRPAEGGGATLRLAADFSAATLDLSRQWGQVFRLLKEKGLEPELQCSVKLAFKCDGETNIFSDLHSLRQFTSRKPFLKELLKDVFPQNETRNEGERRNELRERLGKTLGDTKHEARRIASDSLSFLFIKEVKVASPEAKTYEEETLRQKDKGTLKKQEAEEGISEMQGEETSEGAASELGEDEGSESGEEGEENSEVGKKEEAPVLHEAPRSAFQGLAVVEDRAVEKITKNAEEIGLISLVVDSEPEEEVKRTAASQTKKKETFHGLKELAVSYLVWDSKGKKLMRCQEAPGSQEGGAAALSSQKIEKPCLTLYLSSPSESLGAGSDGPKGHSSTKWSDLRRKTQVTPLIMNKMPQVTHLTVEEAKLIHETEENFRIGVIGVIRQMQREVANVRNLCIFDVQNMKSSLDDLSSLACTIEARVNDQEDAVEALTKDTMQLAREIIDKERLREREDRFRSSNIRVIGIPEKENRENGAVDIIKEVIEENFAELEDQSLEIVSAHRIPNSVDEHRLTPRHILVKFGSAGDKQRILKASRAKQEITYRGSKIRLTADLSPGTIDARSQWCDIIKILQEEGFQPRILYPAKLAFDFRGKTKVFFDIEEFKKFISDTPYLKDLFSNIH